MALIGAESNKTDQADFNGSALPAGVYILRLTTLTSVTTGKRVLVR
jgi:hypothetical protein